MTKDNWMYLLDKGQELHDSNSIDGWDEILAIGERIIEREEADKKEVMRE